MERGIEIILLVLLTLSSGYFSGSETALFSLSNTKIKAYALDSDKRKQLIATLLKQPQDLLVTIFMLNTLVNILLQNVASNMFGNLASWALKVGVPLLITLIAGEMIPKSLGMQHNVSVSYIVAPSISFLQRLLAPARHLIVAITTPISRLMFFFLKREETISREELLHVLKTSEELEVLHQEELDLVCGYLDLQDATVKELMRPRQEVLFYTTDEPLSRLEHLFVDQKCSRIPICQRSFENVLGIISATDYFTHGDNIHTYEDLLKYVSRPIYTPENSLARVTLRRLEEQNQNLSLVVDEYGSISGLITREDILEVVIGQIKDLRDYKPLYSRQSEREIIAEGKLEIDEFNEIFHSDIQSEHNMVTIGGWITEQIGDIPKSGTKFKTAQFFFHVLAVDNNKIKRIYIRKL
jgi:putative hemolysin